MKVYGRVTKVLCRSRPVPSSEGKILFGLGPIDGQFLQDTVCLLGEKCVITCAAL